MNWSIFSLTTPSKYCDDGGSIEVALRRSRLGNGVVLDVSNTYVDGANVDYSRFFERFYRGDVSHNSQKAGYGIGLSMAEELTKLMGGKIFATYKGDRITFTGPPGIIFCPTTAVSVL